MKPESKIAKAAGWLVVSVRLARGIVEDIAAGLRGCDWCDATAGAEHGSGCPEATLFGWRRRQYEDPCPYCWRGDK